MQLFVRDFLSLMLIVCHRLLDRNRNINFRALKVSFACNPSGLNTYIEGHRCYFSDVGGGVLLDFLLQFLCENPSVYFLLADSTKVLV